jgi:predicted acylesterase/phospholipase RssA
LPPHEIHGRLLADGGILDPLPMAPIAAVNADLTIAVSLNGSEPGATRDAEPGITAEWLSRMVRSTTALFDVNAAKSLLDRPTARRRVHAGGGHDDRHVTIVGNAKVDRAGHPTVHVASARDCHRWPGPRHCATRRNRISKLDT